MVEPGWREQKNTEFQRQRSKNESISTLARSKTVCNVSIPRLQASFVERPNERHAVMRTVGTTYIDLGIDDVDETSKNDNEVENVPSVAKVVLQLIKIGVNNGD